MLRLYSRDNKALLRLYRQATKALIIGCADKPVPITQKNTLSPSRMSLTGSLSLSLSLPSPTPPPLPPYIYILICRYTCPDNTRHNLARAAPAVTAAETGICLRRRFRRGLSREHAIRFGKSRRGRGRRRKRPSL
jgi:hypothetical protein